MNISIFIFDHKAIGNCYSASFLCCLINASILPLELFRIRSYTKVINVGPAISGKAIIFEIDFKEQKQVNTVTD